jgi:hypothetical protein
MPKYWYIRGERVTKDLDLPEEVKWYLLKKDPEAIQVIKDPLPEMLDFVQKALAA